MAKMSLVDLLGETRRALDDLRSEHETLRKSHDAVVAKNTALALEVQTLRTKLAAVPA
jgi:regulator of replication initiation timing